MPTLRWLKGMLTDPLLQRVTNVRVPTLRWLKGIKTIKMKKYLIVRVPTLRWLKGIIRSLGGEENISPSANSPLA